MAGRIYRLDDDDSHLLPMDEAPYYSEDLLQELLAKYPDLLAGDQINSDEPRRWLLVSREIAVPDEQDGAGRWSLDHLFLDQDAISTLVEVKRSTDNRIRRAVIGQMLDYAANAVAYWPVEEIQAKFEARCEMEGNDPGEELASLFEEGHDHSDFWQQVKTNLQAGRIRMVFIADDIPSEVRRVVEFLNGQMDPAEVLAIEIKQFVGEGVKTLVPRLIGQTEATRRKKEPGSGASRMDYDTFDLTIDGKTDPALPGKDAIFKIIKHLCAKGASPEDIKHCVSWRDPTSDDKNKAGPMFFEADGEVSSSEFTKEVNVYWRGKLRCFCEEDQLIKFKGRTYAVSTSWTDRTNSAIQQIRNRFPDMGVSCEVH